MYRILVVDDEQRIRELIKKYAVFEGHTVAEAGDGMEAIQICRSRPNDFDIIIMDVMMPELDGFSAAKQAKIRHLMPTRLNHRFCFKPVPDPPQRDNKPAVILQTFAKQFDMGI